MLFPILDDATEEQAVRIAAAESAAAFHHGELVANSLCRSFSPEQPAIRRAVVATLQSIGQRPLGEHFEMRLCEDLAKLDSELTAVPYVNLTLTYGADHRLIPLLERGLTDPSPDIRAMAIVQFAQHGNLDAATRALNAEEPGVQVRAAEAIGWYWTGEAGPIDALSEAVTSDDPDIVRAAKAALRRLRLLDVPTPRTDSETSALTEIDGRFAWNEFLHRWSLQLCGDEEFVLTQDDSTIESGWTGAAPATGDEVAQLEARLGRVLPPSYRTFLLTSNGFITANSVERIRPAAEVRPFSIDESDWIDIWLEAGSEAPSLSIDEHIATRGEEPYCARWELLADTIQVSDTTDGAVYLICPTVTDEHGEWEAWLFATWLAGAQRFASWWDLLTAEHDRWQRYRPLD